VKRIIKYSIFSLSGNLLKVVLLVFFTTICFTFLLVELNSFENGTVMIIKTRENLSSEEIVELASQRCNHYTSRVFYATFGNLTLYKVDENFWRFMLRHIIIGVPPANPFEAIIDSRYGSSINIGDQVQVDSAMYTVVGLFDEPLNSPSRSIVTASSNLSEVNMLVVGLSGFCDQSQITGYVYSLIQEKIERLTLTREGLLIFPSYIFYAFIVVSFLTTSILGILFIRDILQDCLLLLSLGWTTTNIKAYILTVMLIIYCFAGFSGITASRMVSLLIFRIFVIPILDGFVLIAIAIGIVSASTYLRLLLRTDLYQGGEEV